MPDLEDLLTAEAARYDVRQPPVAELFRRRKRRVRARAGAAMAALAVIGAAGVAVGSGQDRLSGREESTAQDAPATSEATPEVVPAAGPSQSAQDAHRDGVLPEVAALSFSERVRVLEQEPTDDGIWAISRVPGLPGVLGDPSGRYGVDWVQRHEYGELLLLDPTGTRILRAVPLPGVPPQTLRVHDDAVYCARQGDGSLPDSMLCRADRNGPGWLVRIFASDGLNRAAAVDHPGWQRQPAPAEAVFDSIVACPQALCVRGRGTAIPFHPTTLVLPYDRSRASDTAVACRHVQSAVEADQRVDGPDDPEWETVKSEMYAAWRAGRTASDPIFVRNLIAPGSLIAGETQTLGDATHRLAGLCGIPIAK